MEQSAESSDEPAQKIARIENTEAKNDQDESQYPFHKVKDLRVLNELREKKLLFLHGKIGDDFKDAVVIVEKKPFDTSDENLKSLVSVQTRLKQNHVNDIYSTYDAVPSISHSEVKATVIYPATQKHIEKYTKQNVEVIEETEEDYNNITLPYLERDNCFSVQWVYNILDKKKESERIIYEDNDPEIGFILLPDMKWDVNDLESLYLIALPHKRGIKSLRDLREEHLPLLENIQKSGQEAIFKKYNIPKSKLRTYLHYQPSYYHLHVHFTHIHFDAPGSTATRAHLLTDVIDNIKMRGDYYQKKTLTFVGRENDKLTLALKESKMMTEK